MSQTDMPIPEKHFRLKMAIKTPPPTTKTEKLREVRTVQKRIAPIKPMVMPEPQLKEEVTKTAMIHKEVKQTAVSSVAPRALKPFDTLKTDTVKTEKNVRIAPEVARAGSAFASPRSLKSFDNTGASAGKTVRVAQFQKKGTLVGVDFAAPHSMKSFSKAGASAGKTVRVARFQGKGTLVGVGFAAPHSMKSFGNAEASTGKTVRVARFQREVSRASVPLASPKAIPANFVDRGATQGYLAGVRRKIDSAKEYPRVAKNSGQQGKVRVRFTILPNGHIRDLKLLAGTPYRILNEEALEMIKRAVPFSRLPDTIGMASLEVILPFTFQLN